MAVTAEGSTHASSVIPVDSCSEAAFGMVTTAFVPLNDSALPYLPAVAQVAPVIVPVFPLPDASVTVVPDPSSNPYAATSPVAAIEGGADASSTAPIPATSATAQPMRPTRVAQFARSPTRLLRSALMSPRPSAGTNRRTTRRLAHNRLSRPVPIGRDASRFG